MDKKILTLFIAGAMTLSLAACGSKTDTPTDTPAPSTDVTAPVETPDEPEATPEAPEETPDEPENTPEASEKPDAKPDAPATTPGSGSESTDYAQGALDILTKTWNSYTEDEKFPSCSGDYSDESAGEGPGIYTQRENDMLNVTFGVPTSYADKIDGVASLMHMMNGNTFTCGVFHLVSGEDVSAFTTALKESVLSRQWMCGFPDTLVIYTSGDYVVSAFGNADLISQFGEKLTAATGAVLVSESPIE